MAVLCQNKGHGTAHHGRSDCSTDARSTGNYPGAAGQDRCVGGGGRGTAKADARQDTSELLRTPEHRVISTGLQNLFGAAAVVRNAPAAVPSGPRVKRGELATRRQSESRGLVSETAVCGRGGGVDMGPTAPRRAANGGLAACGRAAQLPRRAVTFRGLRTTPGYQTRSGGNPPGYALAVAMGGEAAFCCR